LSRDEAAAPPKLVTLDNALVAVMDPHRIVDARSAPERFGAWVENACLAHAWNAGQQVSLLELVRRHPELRPLVICDDAGRATAERAGVGAIASQDFLLGGPSGASRS
jgi:hypothetical protein